jgi:hypothetical protein
MGTGIQYQQCGNNARHQRWDRLERAELFARYDALPVQGLSQRQAAEVLEIPRSTLQAWRTYQARRDACPTVVAFLHRVPGLAFLHRLVLAIHLVWTEVGACGMRLGCLVLPLTGLNRFVGASYGTPPQVNQRVEEALIASRQAARMRLAQEMPPKEIPMAQDATFTGGLCWIGIEPVSNSMVLEQRAPARDQDTWPTLMEQALAGLTCHVRQSPSDEAPGLLAYVEHHLGAPHAPDVFHGQHALSTAVAVPLAATQRAAHKTVAKAEEMLQRVHARLETTTDEPARRGPGRPPKVTPCLEPVEQEVEAARHEHQRLAGQREAVTQNRRAMGHAYHFGDLERGVRRNGKLSAGAIHQHIDTIRTRAQHAGLRQACLERIAKAARVVPNRPAPIAFVSGYVRQQGRQLHVAPPASSALHAHLIPSYDLERGASTRTVTAGEPRRELAARLRTPLFAPDGAWGQLSLAEQRPRSSLRYASAQAPMWKGVTGTFRCGITSVEDSIIPASGPV